jgi:predicted PurR-regulated permease PerM
MTISFQKIFYVLASSILFFYILIIGKSLLIPISMALLLSFILYPLVKKLNEKHLSNILSVSIALLSFLLLVSGILFFFYTQLSHLPAEIGQFQTKIYGLLADVIYLINQKFNLETTLNQAFLTEKIKIWVQQAAFPIAENTLTMSTSILTAVFSTFIYAFLILLYRRNIVAALVLFAPEENQSTIKIMLRNIQKVGQQYLGGMFTLFLILGTSSSIGLWIIGIDNPFLFGFFAAALSIVPYVGSTIGAIIPVLYAFMTHDSLWVPFSVLALFWVLQMLENNFLSPKIVGNSLNLNALTAIISLLLGAMVWGVSGMILFLPFTAMFNVFCNTVPSLKPLALLMGNIPDEAETKDDYTIKNLIKTIWQKMKKKE